MGRVSGEDWPPSFWTVIVGAERVPRPVAGVVMTGQTQVWVILEYYI